ncbi:tetratricopeptide repeat protein [Dactylosporangium sp. CA-092794]|uniref:tetratricopeptide repeat protein n=1 Tax=Dactylosporangium sp. CA-092794 TaxID=3239929 RepID=UPI003D918690
MTAEPPVEWDSVLAFARALDEAGEPGHAAAALADPLRTLDPATAGPDGDVIAAAMLYATLAKPALDRVPDAIAWARYARTAAERLHGGDDPATVTATEVLALVLARRGRFQEADELRRLLIRRHRDRGDIDAQHLAQMDLAVQWHMAGRCGEAVREATVVWQQWTTRHDPAEEASVPMVWQLATLLHACGRVGEAQAVVAAADPEHPGGSEPRAETYLELMASIATAVLRHQRVCVHHLDHDFDRADPSVAGWRPR